MSESDILRKNEVLEACNDLSLLNLVFLLCFVFNCSNTEKISKLTKYKSDEVSQDSAMNGNVYFKHK